MKLRIIIIFFITALFTLPLTPFLALQPDLQYIINPGTDETLENAVLLGTRFELSL